ncbi:MAG: hypothetical protein HKN90_08550 [Flavobacteriaceae bacterium]|nr:hypothetical protein [Flavobacteriaceae bacterium]
MNTKLIPASIESEVLSALSYYKELESVPIKFIFKKDIKRSVMLAQPQISSLFLPKNKRKYSIKISEDFKITGKIFKTEQLPKDVLIGWIGHELGHICDYEQMSNLELIWYGFKYVTSKKFLKLAEKRADTYAVRNGMKTYIITTKNFILNHADISDRYKEKIKEYYLSPEEIMLMLPSES